MNGQTASLNECVVVDSDIEGPCWQPDSLASDSSCTSSVETARADEPAAPAADLPPVLVAEQVVGADRTFLLNRPLRVPLTCDNGLWCCEDHDLRVSGYGQTAQTAVAAFCEDFSVTYDGLVNEPDAALSGDAQRVKHRMVQLVARVVPRGDVRVATFILHRPADSLSRSLPSPDPAVLRNGIGYLDCPGVLMG